MLRMLILPAACLLTGCAGSLVGDAIAGPEKLARQDDAYCRSIGAQDQAYTQCRLFLTQQRASKHERALDRLTYGPPSVTCTTYGPTTTCH